MPGATPHRRAFGPAPAQALSPVPTNVVATAVRGALLVTWTPAAPSQGYLFYRIDIDPPPTPTGNGNAQVNQYSASEWVSAGANAALLIGQSGVSAAGWLNTLFGVAVRARVTGWRPDTGYGAPSAWSNSATGTKTTNGVILGAQTPYGTGVGCVSAPTTVQNNAVLSTPGTYSGIDFQLTTGGAGWTGLVLDPGKGNTIRLANVRFQCSNPDAINGVSSGTLVAVKSGTAILQNYELDGAGPGGAAFGISDNPSGAANLDGVQLLNGLHHGCEDDIHFGFTGTNGVNGTDGVAFDLCPHAFNGSAAHNDGLQMTGGSIQLTRWDLRNSQTENSCAYCNPSTGDVAAFSLFDCWGDGGGGGQIVCTTSGGHVGPVVVIHKFKVRRQPFGFWKWGGFIGTSPAVPAAINNGAGLTLDLGSPDQNQYWEPNGELLVPAGL